MLIKESRPPRGVYESHLLQAYKPCIIGAKVWDGIVPMTQVSGRDEFHIPYVVALGDMLQYSHCGNITTNQWFFNSSNHRNLFYNMQN